MSHELIGDRCGAHKYTQIFLVVVVPSSGTRTHPRSSAHTTQHNNGSDAVSSHETFRQAAGNRSATKPPVESPRFARPTPAHRRLLKRKRRPVPNRLFAGAT
eukprot:COSAG02_NODE_1537_length_12050_cov_219.008116_2_plen_102_part_00